MRRQPFVLAVALALAMALAGCSVQGFDAEKLLRAPQLSGEGSAVQKALNSYLGGSATLKYPASGEFLSPFLFDDWDGDGDQEAAVLYTLDSAGTNVWLAVLEPDGDGGWRVSETAEGLSSEVDSVNTAPLRDETSRQILVGYTSAQGDRYLVVYLYGEEGLQPIVQQAYSQLLLADLNGGGVTQDLILALPTEEESTGVDLLVLTYDQGEFHQAKTREVGRGGMNGCVALHAGTRRNGEQYLVMDGWAATGGGSLTSAILDYDRETHFFSVYTPKNVADPYRAALRYDTTLVSQDIDGNGTIDIPTELDDGGTLVPPMDKQLHFLYWTDFASRGASGCFGIYDSTNGFFLPLPDSLYGNVRVRSNAGGNGWLLVNAENAIVYCELRVVDPAETQKDERYQRVATLGSRQLQIRTITRYDGLALEDVAGSILILQ